MTEIPQATLTEAFTVATTQRLVREQVRPVATRCARYADPARTRRRAEALLRLALDPAATDAERSLAAARAAVFLRRSA